MKKGLLLVAIVGDWNGGSHGKLPITLYYDSENKEKPFFSSEGWGWGLMGNQYSLQDLEGYNLIEDYNNTESLWVYELLKMFAAKKMNSIEAGEAILTAFPGNEPNITEHQYSLLMKGHA